MKINNSFNLNIMDKFNKKNLKYESTAVFKATQLTFGCDISESPFEFAIEVFDGKNKKVIKPGERWDDETSNPLADVASWVKNTSNVKCKYYPFCGMLTEKEKEFFKVKNEFDCCECEYKKDCISEYYRTIKLQHFFKE